LSLRATLRWVSPAASRSRASRCWCGVSVGLRPNFHAFGPRVGTAAREATALELRGDAKHGEDKLGAIGRGIDNRLGNRTQARAGALHAAGDHPKIGGVAREPVNRWNDHNIAVGKGGH